ncbi:MAG: hypothetical protein OXI81_09840 [Paracoccaceae bacterium]|nr:hypothetical protein [Paracoccaceae bacterium]
MVRACAEFFLSIRENRGPRRPIPQAARPANLPEGYAVQSALVDGLIDRHGGRVVGYKAACTSIHAQQLLGVDSPIFGCLLSQFSWPGGVTLPRPEIPTLAVEPEFAFVMAGDVPVFPEPGGRWTPESITGHVGDMLPALELVGHGFTDWSSYDPPSLAADNAVQQGWVYGEPFEGWRDLTLSACPVTLSADGRLCRSGSGANVLGHPMKVVAWLANTLPSYGHRLRRGDRVTTGVCTDIYPIRPGEHIRADFGALGSVELTFSA